MLYHSVPTPLGHVTLFEEKGSLVAMEWGKAKGGSESPLLRRAAVQLREYFAGDRRDFDLPLAPKGTSFQRRVWAALRRIPFGHTASYGDIAREVDSGPRAIGGVCRSNPLPIFTPCHRVTGAKGSLGGYSGHEGLDTKRWLLSHEGARIAETKRRKSGGAI